MDCPLVIFDPSARLAIGKILNYPADMWKQTSAEYFEGTEFIEVKVRATNHRTSLRLYYGGLLEIIKTDLTRSQRDQLFITPDGNYRFFEGLYFGGGEIEIAMRPTAAELEDPPKMIQDTRDVFSKVVSVVRESLRPMLG